MPSKNTFGKTILLVEDDTKDEQLTMAALSRDGLADQVMIVRDGAEALDYLYCRNKYKLRNKQNPIVVLLDNKMPKLCGLDVLKNIKGSEELRSIPVVVFSSSDAMSEVDEFYKRGANAYVVKPLIFTEFVNVIKDLGTFWARVNLPPSFAGDEKLPKVSEDKKIS